MFFSNFDLNLIKQKLIEHLVKKIGFEIKKASNYLCIKTNKLWFSYIRHFLAPGFVKECFLRVADVLCPEKKEQFVQISLCGQTIAHRIEELGNSIEANLVSKTEDFTFYSLALDESTDIKDFAQLAIFVRGVAERFCVIEELAAMVPLKGSTKGTDLLETVMTTLNPLKFNLKNISGVTTDGAYLCVEVDKD